MCNLLQIKLLNLNHVEKRKLTKNDTVMRSTRKKTGRGRRMWMFEIKANVQTRDKTCREVKWYRC